LLAQLVPERVAGAVTSEPSRYLFLAGSLPYLLLGTAHALATPLRPADRKGLAPSDPQLPEAMARTPLRLTRRTDMWRAWIGFNFSHSLGLLVLGALILLIGRSEAAFRAQASLFVPFALLASVAYLLLATKYWFRTPIIACALSLALFLGSWMALMLEAR
jgi:hypothetical protein